MFYSGGVVLGHKVHPRQALDAFDGVSFTLVRLKRFDGHCGFSGFTQTYDGSFIGLAGKSLW